VPVWADDPREEHEIPYLARWGAGVTSLESVRFSYRLGVAYADHLCERVHTALDGAGVLADTALILTADHGESLGEHDVWFDHAGLFRETLGVPLIVRPPGAARPGRSVDTRSTGLDVVPTLRALAGLRADPSHAGVDLFALARGDAPTDRRVFFAYSDMHQLGYHDSEAHFFTTLTDQLRIGTTLVVKDGKTVPQRREPIARGTGALYDPRADPALVHDLAAEQPRRAAAAAKLLEAWRAGLDRRRSERRDVSPDEEQGLRDMGYAGD
jgi:arylsulfatase A-like enzyme